MAESSTAQVTQIAGFIDGRFLRSEGYLDVEEPQIMEIVLSKVNDEDCKIVSFG